MTRPLSFDYVMFAKLLHKRADQLVIVYAVGSDDCRLVVLSLN